MLSQSLFVVPGRRGWGTCSSLSAPGSCPASGTAHASNGAGTTRTSGGADVWNRTQSSMSQGGYITERGRGVQDFHVLFIFQRSMRKIAQKWFFEIDIRQLVHKWFFLRLITNFLKKFTECSPPKSAPICTGVGLPLPLGGVLMLGVLRTDPRLLRALPGWRPLGVGGGRLA